MRSFLVATLVLVIVGGAAAVGVPALGRHLDEQALGQTRTAARQITLPPGATASGACHGGGVTGCWTVGAPVASVRDSVVRSWQPGHPLEVSCHTVVLEPFRPHDECSIGVRRRGRVALVLLRADVDRQSGDATGTLVAVHDGSS